MKAIDVRLSGIGKTDLLGCRQTSAETLWGDEVEAEANRQTVRKGGRAKR